MSKTCDWFGKSWETEEGAARAAERCPLIVFPIQRRSDGRWVLTTERAQGGSL